MKGSAGYAAGARRFVMAAVVVGALLALGTAIDQGMVRRGEVDGATVPAGPSTSAPVTATTTPVREAPLPHPLVVDHLVLGSKRLGETAAYAARHYGTRSAALRPTMIVLHYSESDTYSSVRSVFESDEPNRGELPGTCAHYVVDQDGAAYELVPPTVMCRHTVGLNHLAIGIEFVQASHGHDPRWAAQQVLRRKAQVAAGVALVEHLQEEFAIADDDVIGHAMANDDKRFRDREGWRNDHADWQLPEVSAFRRLLAADP